MMISMLLHGKIGCETIVEDYVSSSSIKKIIIFNIKLVVYFAIFIAVISILSILFRS